MNDQPHLRMSLVAAVTRRYPFLSGGNKVAGNRWVNWFSGSPSGMFWVKVEGGKLLVPVDDYVGRAVFYIGDLDRKISWIIDRTVTPGSVALDVGANLGIVTLRLAARVGSSGMVHAFEPNPNLVAILNVSLAANGLHNVEVHPFALGKEAANLSLTIPRGENNLGAATLTDAFSHVESETFEVPVQTLDDCFDEATLRRIEFLKLDVEGFESQVLAGGRRFFTEHQPTVIVFEEKEPYTKRRCPESIGNLFDFGYDVFAVPKNLFFVKLVNLAHVNEASSFDYVAITRADKSRDVRKKLGIAR